VAASVALATHEPLHATVPAAHVAPQVPIEQTCPVAQLLPHEPQLAPLPAVLTSQPLVASSSQSA
jgi:hypothetical protein